jgi:hypothetical protein
LKAVRGGEEEQDAGVNEAKASARAQAQEELGDIYPLIEAENAATTDV